MVSDYYKLPFGGQLLVWTSRMYVNGYSKCIPNKSEMIKMAYIKVNIFNGYDLLSKFLSLLLDNNKFILQNINSRKLNENEILLTECVEYYKNYNDKNAIFIKAWELINTKEQFIANSQNLAKAYLSVNLHTSNRVNNYNHNTNNFLRSNQSYTIH